MGRPPCCDETNVKRGRWTAQEDAKILAYVASHGVGVGVGVGNWTLVPQKQIQDLRPDVKHEDFTAEEEDYIIKLHKAIGSRWSLIAKQFPGRTYNYVKNYWNTKLIKKLINMGINPITHKPISTVVTDCHNIINLTTQTASYNRLLREQQLTILSLTVPSYLAYFSHQYSTTQAPCVPQSPTASSSSSCSVNQC